MGNSNKFEYTEKLETGKYIPATCSVLFLDIVDFATKAKTNKDMKSVVRNLQHSLNDALDDYEWDEEKKPNDLILSPTGDGYAITFSNAMKDETVLSVAKDIYRDLTNAKHEVRMGINKGPNLTFLDLNHKMNIIGWGIVYAQRVMSIAEVNQILCTERFAKPLIESKTIPALHYIGIGKFKHGIKMGVYNYYKTGGKDAFGNAQLPSTENLDPKDEED